MVKHNLTKTELQIIRQLELNSRQTFSKIGKKVGMSQQRVSYTVNALMQKGLITHFYTLIDYSKFDVLHFRVYFNLSYTNEKKLEDLINYFIKEDHTCRISSCGGRFDLQVTFFALNPSQFNKTLRDIMAKFPEQISGYIVLTTIVKRIFRRKYLYRSNALIPEVIIGGDRLPEIVDDTDMEILNSIAENARVNAVSISNNLDLTSKTVIQRIKNLKERNIIRGYRQILDVRSRDLESVLLVIKYHNITTEMEDKFINYLRSHPNVTNLVKTLGEWDIEISIEGQDQLEIRKVEMEIRREFGIMIQQTEKIPIYQIHKINYFPKFLLSMKKDEKKQLKEFVESEMIPEN
jgi:DNA-binding Lrp family transcriptional regulator